MVAEGKKRNRRVCHMNFDIEGTKYDITPEQIVHAMNAFDSGDCQTYYTNFLTDRRFTRAVEHEGHHYPPKFLISHATGIPGSDFHAYTAEDILTQLRFSVVDKPNPGVSTSVEESSRTPPSNPTPGNNGQNQSSGWTLDKVKKVLEIVVTAFAVITGAVTAVSGVIALLKSK